MLRFIQVVPADTIRFWWELFVQLHNFRQSGYSEMCDVLLFVPYRSSIYEGYKQLFDTFPEVDFYTIYDEDGSVLKLVNSASYQPIIRLWTLKKYFELRPELQNDVFFYHDSDILFVDKLDLSPYIDDNVAYMSDTSSYLNSDYFDSKEKDVKPERLNNYKSRDILAECAGFAGITREICERNKNKTGGAQYILKQLNAKFFEDCIETCLIVRNHLRATNQQYMKGDTPPERENNGFQSWCADMWAILWNLWRRGIETETPKELDFLWATDEIENIGYRKIFHNAGVTSSSKLTRKFGQETIDCPAFYKGNYLTLAPWDRDTQQIGAIQEVVNHPVSKLYCTSLYAKAILDTQKTYSL